MKMTFIYALKCPITDCFDYVGMTGNLCERFGKHGREGFVLDELSNAEDGRVAEKLWIAFFREQGYALRNKNSGGAGPIKQTSETKAKMRAAHKSNPKSLAQCAKMSAANVGKKRSAATCTKISARQRGVPESDEVRRQMRVKRDGVSRFHGVSWRRDAGKWRARVSILGNHIHAGSFISEIDAARAYDTTAKQYLGAFAVLNFPG